MKSIGSYEAKTHLPRLLSQVEQGETITITKRGRPVAVLSPAPPMPQREVKAGVPGTPYSIPPPNAAFRVHSSDVPGTPYSIPPPSAAFEVPGTPYSIPPPSAAFGVIEIRRVPVSN